MSALIWAAAAAGWGVAIILALVLSARAGRRETTLSLRLRATVEPYLLRRAQEMNVTASSSSSSEQLDEVVESICRIAERLTASEKDGFSETQRMAVARTLPIDKPKL